MSKSFGAHRALDCIRSQRRAWRTRCAARTVRLRQDDAPAPYRRARADERRLACFRRGGCGTALDPGAAHRFRLPALRVVSAHDGVRQCRLWPDSAAATQATVAAPRSRRASTNCSTSFGSGTSERAIRHSSRADRSGAWPSPARSPSSRACSCSTSRSARWTPRSARTCALAARNPRPTGLTTIFVTHDQTEAMEIADRVAIMNAGRIEQIGAPKEVVDRPQTSSSEHS